MPYVLIHHNVTDYDKFRAIFDEDAERRRRLGSQGGRLMRAAGSPNDLFALFEWDTVENARKFVASYETREAFEWVLPVEEIRAFVIEDVDEVDS
jgi:hypothetical protein